MMTRGELAIERALARLADPDPAVVDAQLAELRRVVAAALHARWSSAATVPGVDALSIAALSEVVERGSIDDWLRVLARVRSAKRAMSKPVPSDS